MMAQIEINPPRNDLRNSQLSNSTVRNLVVVTSEPSDHCGQGGVRRSAGPGGLLCTRIAAHTVAGSAAWCRRRSGINRISPWSVDPIGAVPGRTVDLPTDLSGIRRRLNQEEGSRPQHDAMGAAIFALRSADAVVAGPLSPDDANAAGLLPHVADLASQAYRALRPPRALIVHPCFAQVARRFQFIQMSHRDARALGAGASDIGILAQRLRQLQGDPGEFAITALANRGLLWADGTWWEIEPIGSGDIDEAVAGSVFCLAWVVARTFRGKSAPQALAYARAAVASAVR